MGIFGTVKPKYVQGGSTVLIDFAVLIKDNPDPDFVVHQSPLSGARVIVYRGYHWVYEVDVHLHLESDPTAKFNIYNGDLGLEMALHRDRNKGSLGTFVLVDVPPRYVTFSGFEDIVRLKFISKNFVDLATTT